MTPWTRALVALGALSAWLVVLLLGLLPPLVAHLLLAAALVLFPWRLLSAGGADEDGDGGDPDER